MTLLDVQNAKYELEQEIKQKKAVLKALGVVEAALRPDTGSHPGHDEKFPGLHAFVRDNLTSLRPEFTAEDVVKRAADLGLKYPRLRVQGVLADLKQKGVVETVKRGGKGFGVSSFRLTPSEVPLSSDIALWHAEAPTKPSATDQSSPAES